ncbi:SCO family protein [Siccirubricoccus sp. KC 17139]|uniref:SCO family protein n=1 Tax=Siccirubricoccus soli TaxID=2899147 RepID=A0ABT1DBW3_9PROT|nr:SCO family protein [Siccirubricoccus soli]MCO6419389.1 SCO family protein [Siccirubricoccus soli]MCP2685524.1 SCO family protein [Siccirubricoccus soli]
MLRVIRLLAFLLILLLGGAWALAWATRAPEESLVDAFANRIAQLFGGQAPVAAMGGISLPQGMTLGGSFSLVNQDGRAVTERDYAGRWMLVYFGYSYCPDVCPTELGAMTAALDQLGPLAEQVVPVFVSVDPERDTPAHLADYVSRFHPRLQGLTGTPEQVAEAARRFRVYYAKVQRPDMTDYLMDHSSFVYLVGPDARVRSLFRPDTSPEAMAAAVQAQLGAASRRS